MNELISFIPSRTHVATLAVRDDGAETTGESDAVERVIAAFNAYREGVEQHAENLPALRAECVAATSAPLGTTGRRAWPADSHVLVKRHRASGDSIDTQALIQRGGVNVKGEAISENAEMVWYYGALMECAVMIVGFEGSAFEDPETCDKDEDDNPIPGTGEAFRIPALPPTSMDDMGQRKKVYYKRIEAMRILPDAVIALVVEKLREIPADPFGLPKPGNDSANASTARSPRKATPKLKEHATSE